MDLIYEKDDFAVAFNHFLDHTLESFLEFSLIFGTSDKCAEIKRIDLTALEVFRHIAVNYLLGYAL